LICVPYCCRAQELEQSAEWREALALVKDRKGSDENLQAGIKRLEELLSFAASPLDGDKITLVLATCYFLTNRYDDGIRLLEPLAERNPKLELDLAEEAKISGLSALPMLGHCYYGKGEWQKAIDVFEQVLLYRPDAPVILTGLATAREKLAEMGKLGSAPIVLVNGRYVPQSVTSDGGTILCPVTSLAESLNLSADVSGGRITLAGAQPSTEEWQCVLTPVFAGMRTTVVEDRYWELDWRDRGEQHLENRNHKD
jgi:tetratricopeptide (TPR) repeat protein